MNAFGIKQVTPDHKECGCTVKNIKTEEGNRPCIKCGAKVDKDGY